jgi:hypothetical protein
VGYTFSAASQRQTAKTTEWQPSVKGR